MKRDVVIVGAGPAGAVAAASLARRGRDVLLLDRSDFPRDKVCGDGIPPGTIEQLAEIGLAEKIRGAGFHTVDRIRIGSPAGRVWESGFQPRRPGLEFYVASRSRFDALLFDHAVDCGAEFLRTGVTGLVRESGRVTGVTTTAGPVDARFTIGADGATSVVARELGVLPRPRRHRDVAIRGYVDGMETAPHTVEFYFLDRFLPGYGWVFPLGDGRANVGVIVGVERLKESGVSLRDLLVEFMQMDAVRDRAAGARLEGVGSWQLPLDAPPWPDRAFDGALLAGDAGGFIDPLTGEGIHTAVRTGAIAADVIDSALREDTASLSSYDERCRRELGALARRSHRCQRWIALAPVALESLFVIANAAPGLVRAWLNRVSTDFVVE